MLDDVTELTIFLSGSNDADVLKRCPQPTLTWFQKGSVCVGACMCVHVHTCVCIPTQIERVWRMLTEDEPK